MQMIIIRHSGQKGGVCVTRSLGKDKANGTAHSFSTVESAFASKPDKPLDSLSSSSSSSSSGYLSVHWPVSIFSFWTERLSWNRPRRMLIKRTVCPTINWCDVCCSPSGMTPMISIPFRLVIIGRLFIVLVSREEGEENHVMQKIRTEARILYIVLRGGCKKRFDKDQTEIMRAIIIKWEVSMWNIFGSCNLNN